MKKIRKIRTQTCWYSCCSYCYCRSWLWSLVSSS